MPDIGTVRSWQGRTLVDRDGSRIGPIDAIYLDDQTGEPEWALITTGLFGTKASFVPLTQATQTDDEVRVPYDKQLVNHAPRIDPDRHLSEAEERQLWRHYGLDYDLDYDRPTSRRRASGRDPAGRDRSGPTTDAAMTRSEEELRVGTQTRERGRARLRKYLTTETQQVTVPVRREQVRVEREPITDANLDAATSGPELSEAEHEVILREEEPVVDKRVVPKERVRLDKDTVTGEERVAEELRKEQIELQDHDTTGGRRDRRRRQ